MQMGILEIRNCVVQKVAHVWQLYPLGPSLAQDSQAGTVVSGKLINSSTLIQCVSSFSNKKSFNNISVKILKLCISPFSSLNHSTPPASWKVYKVRS